MERGLLRLGKKVLLGALLAALCLACSNLNTKKPTSTISKTNTTSTTADAPQRAVEKRASGARFFRVSPPDTSGKSRELSENEAVFPRDRLTLELTYPQAVPFDAKSGLELRVWLKSGGSARPLILPFKWEGGGSAPPSHRLVWVLDVKKLYGGSVSREPIEMSVDAAGLEKLIVEPIQKLALTVPAKQSWPLRLAGRDADSGEAAGFPLLLEHGELPSEVELTVRRTDLPGNLSFKVDGLPAALSYTQRQTTPASLKLYIPSPPSANQPENFPDDAEFEVTLTEGAGREEVAKASFKPAQLLSLRASQPEAPLTAYRLGSVVNITATVNKPLQPESRLQLTLSNGKTVDLELDASNKLFSGSCRVQAPLSGTELKIALASGNNLKIASSEKNNWTTPVDWVLLVQPAKTASFAIAVDSELPRLSSIKVERTADSVELTAASPPLKMGETATLKLTFSEEVQITQSQLSYGGRGTVVWNTSPEQFSAEHSLTFTPSARYQGDVFFSLPWEAYQDKAGNQGVGTGASTAFPVDTLFKISAVSITPARGTTIGENGLVEIAVTFNQAVTISGTPRLPFTIGSDSSKFAGYDLSRSAGNAAVAVFTYQVQPRDSGDLEVSHAASISLEDGASIQDRQGGAVFSLLLPSGARGGRVDNQAAWVKAVDFSPAFGDLLRRSDFVDITVTFSAAVRVGGSPSIAFIMGSGEGISKTATYDSTATEALNVPAKLLFRYRVQDGDNGALRIAAGTSIVLGLGGSISNAGPSNTTPPQLALGGERYAGSVDNLAPTISAVEFNPAAASSVSYGGNVDITVTFSESVSVVNPAANFPQIAFFIGSGAGASKTASYQSEATGALNDPKKLRFRYVVTDRVNGALSIAAAASIELGASGSIISDLVGNAAALVLNTTSTPGGIVDTTAPTISGVEFSPAAGSQVRQGGNVDITVTFSEPMKVASSDRNFPRIDFLIGSGEGASKKASYHRAATEALNDLKKLRFRYEVQEGDSGIITIAADSRIELGASGSSISDLVGNAAELVVLTAPSGGTVDAVLPTVNRVIITPELGASVGRYDSIADTIAGEILISVTYSKAITVEGKPGIPFLINNTPRSAIYHQGSGSTTLVFRRYPLAWDDKGDVSIEAATSIALGAGGSMRDAVGNPAPTSLGLEAAKVGGRVYLGPMVTAIDITPARADYVEVGGEVIIAVTFDEAVAVTGTPTLPFRIGDATRREAKYDASRTATRNQVGVLVFSYPLPALEETDGKILLLGKIVLPAGATIQSVAQSEQPAVLRFAKVSGGRVVMASDLAPADNALAAQDGYVFDSSNGKDGSTPAKAIGVKWHPANGTNVDFAAGSMLHLDALVQRTFASTLRFERVNSDSTLVGLTDADPVVEGFQHAFAPGPWTLKITDLATSTRAEKSLYFTLNFFVPLLSPTIVNSSLLQVSNLLTGASWRYSLNGGSVWTDVAADTPSSSLPAGIYSETALRRLKVQQQADGLLSAAAALPESALSHTFVVGPAPSTSYRALRIASSKEPAQNGNRVVLPPELAAQSVSFWAQAASLSAELSMLFSARAAADVQLFYENDKLVFWRDIGNKKVSKDQASPLSWHHYLVVKNGATLTFYRDGQQLWAEASTSFDDKNAFHTIVFGNDDRNPSKHENWKRQFEGLIKGIQLWNKTFNAEEAQTHYNRGRELPSDISKLVAFYPLQGETMSDVVAGGQNLPAIEFNADNLYAAGMVGATVVDGRPSAPLSAVNASVKVAVGQTSYQLSRADLSGIPAGATISWSWVKPSSGATSETVTLTGGESPTLSTADGAVQVSATSSKTDDYLEGTATFIVTFFAAKQAGTLTHAPSASGNNAGYVFVASSDKDGSSAARAIGVQENNLSTTVGSALRLDTLVAGVVGTLSYRSVVDGPESNPLVDADTQLAGFQYNTAATGGMAIFKVSDSGNDWVEEKALYFCVLVNPTTFFPTVSSGQVGVSGLLDSSSFWQYSFDGGSSWSAEIARATTSVTPPNGVYSKTALRRLRVRQKVDGIFGRAVALSAEALNAAPTFVVDPAPVTSVKALRVASSDALDQKNNRVVLPAELSAQSVAFWARPLSVPTTDLTMLLCAYQSGGFQLYYKRKNASINLGLHSKSDGMEKSYVMTESTTASPFNWHHFLVVREGALVVVYLDGVKVPGLEGAATGNMSKLVFGNDYRDAGAHSDWPRRFNGLIKGIQLWDKIFDAAGALELYNKGRRLPSDVSQLVAFYPLQGETMSDVVAGGQSLGAISFDASNLYAAGMVGATVEDGRFPSTLKAKLDTVRVIVGQTNFWLIRELLGGIPTGATISWSQTLPSSGATTGTVTLTGDGESPTLSTTVADGAVQVSATSSVTDDYLAGTATFKVYFSRHTSSLAHAPNAGGNNVGYVFDVSNNKDGSSADRAIVVRGHNLSLTVGITVRLDTLVSGVVGALSYRSVVGGGGESNPLVDADTQLAGFQYDTPASVTEVIFKVSDAGTATQEGKALYFRLPLGPAILTPVVRRDQVGVSGLVGSDWQYSFDGGSSWSGELLSATRRVALPNGVYSKTALSRLRVRQKENNIYSSPVALSAEALAAAPTFVVGARPSTGQSAWRIATSSIAQNFNRLVLPPELTAQSVAFWAKIEADPTGDLGMIFSLREVMDIQMYYDMKGGNYINFWNDHSSSGQLRSVNRQEWYHFLFVKISTSVIVYINGRNDNKVILGHHFSDKTFRKMVFGNDHRNPQAHDNFQRQFNGLIKGIQLWDKTFDAAGAQELYNKGGALPDDISQLKAFYPLQETPVKDMVAGGPTLGGITFDGANPYAPGIVGGSLVTG